MGKHMNILVEKQRYPLGVVHVDGRIMLQRILNKKDVRKWSRAHVGSCEHGNMYRERRLLC